MRHIAAVLAAATLALPALAEDSWFPSRYGAADRVGAANNLTAEGVLKAAKLVKTGKVYALGVVTGPKTPVWPGRSYKLVVTPIDDGGGAPMGAGKVTGHDDVLMTHIGIGTQIDGFAHVGIDRRHYNGVHARDFFQPDGVTQFGTENIPPTATRGILLDMARHYGKSPVPAGTAFNREDIDAAAKAAGVSIGKGDVVLFHTGWMAKAEKDPLGYIASQPGLGTAGAEYLASLGVVMVGADTAALEAIPFEDAARPFPVHQALLTRHGVYILESVNTAELAKDRATEFLFVLGPPRFKGTVQAVVNPVAIR